jgi:hypothetical protein
MSPSLADRPARRRDEWEMSNLTIASIVLRSSSALKQRWPLIISHRTTAMPNRSDWIDAGAVPTMRSGPMYALVPAWDMSCGRGSQDEEAEL